MDSPHSFNKYLLTISHVPGTVLGAGETKRTKKINQTNNQPTKQTTKTLPLRCAHSSEVVLSQVLILLHTFPEILFPEDDEPSKQFPLNMQKCPGFHYEINTYVK